MGAKRVMFFIWKNSFYKDSPAGDNITTGSCNIIIGANIDAPDYAGNHQLNIGNTIYGDMVTRNVGIGTDGLVEKLNIDGNIVLTKDAVRSIYIETANLGEGQSLTLRAGNAAGVTGLAVTGGTLILQAGTGRNANQPINCGGNLYLRSGGNYGTALPGSRNGGDIILETGGANNTLVERIRITESGYVGIGDVTPGNKLENHPRLRWQ